jgi:hypothetical protein
MVGNMSWPDAVVAIVAIVAIVVALGIAAWFIGSKT